MGSFNSSSDSDWYCSHRFTRSGIATASNPTVSACLRSDSLNLCIYFTLHQKYTLTDTVSKLFERLVLQMIYKFYWFLPALEDIYQDLGETPNWPESPRRKRHLKPTLELALALISYAHMRLTQQYLNGGRQ